MLDVRLPELGLWYPLYSTYVENDRDAAAWLSPGGCIGKGSYSDVVVEAGVWHRIVLTVGSERLGYFVGGENVLTLDGGGLDGPFSLYGREHQTCFILFFADGKGNDATIDVKRVALYGRVLTDQEVSGLGGAADEIGV